MRDQAAPAPAPPAEQPPPAQPSATFIAARHGRGPPPPPTDRPTDRQRRSPVAAPGAAGRRRGRSSEGAEVSSSVEHHLHGDGRRGRRRLCQPGAALAAGQRVRRACGEESGSLLQLTASYTALFLLTSYKQAASLLPGATCEKEGKGDLAAGDLNFRWIKGLR